MSKSKYDKYVVKKPAYEVIPKFEVKGRIPAMTLMSSNLVPGTKMYIETGWVLGMPDPNPHIGEHTHDYDEIVLHIGTDPNNPDTDGDGYSDSDEIKSGHDPKGTGILNP